jgi:hypothetical protein
VRQHRVTYFYYLGAMPTLLLRMPADPADRDHRPVGYKKMQVTDADGRPVPAGAGMMDTYLPIPEKFSRWPGYPARAGGPWLWRILVLSLFQAVVVPSGLSTTVQPLRWIST